MQPVAGGHRSTFTTVVEQRKEGRTVAFLSNISTPVSSSSGASHHLNLHCCCAPTYALRHKAGRRSTAQRGRLAKAGADGRGQRDHEATLLRLGGICHRLVSLVATATFNLRTRGREDLCLDFWRAPCRPPALSTLASCYEYI
jgi:hypothetical protein